MRADTSYKKIIEKARRICDCKDYNKRKWFVEYGIFIVDAVFEFHFRKDALHNKYLLVNSRSKKARVFDEKDRILYTLRYTGEAK